MSTVEKGALWAKRWGSPSGWVIFKILTCRFSSLPCLLPFHPPIKWGVVLVHRDQERGWGWGRRQQRVSNKPWLLALGGWPQIKVRAWDICCQPLVLEGGLAFQRTFGSVWRYPSLSQLGRRLWHLTGRGQECC